MDLSKLSESERRKYSNDLLKKYINNNNPHCCMFQDCKNLSIKSHAVSKQYYLKRIAEDNQIGLFKAKQVESGRDLFWDKIGINVASVFKGFCKLHDDLFNEIDKKGITSQRSLLLQCYRTVCSWLYSIELTSALFGEDQDNKDETRRILTAKMGLKTDYCEQSKQLKKRNDVFLLYIIKKKFEAALKNIKDESLQKYTSFDGIEIMCCKAPDVIPVVLNSMVSLEIGNVFHIVLPNENTTDLIFINSTNGQLRFVEAWFARTQNMLNIIGLIESWMIANELWFIRPSVFEKLPEDRRSIIKADIRYATCERKLWEPYDVSIFDDLRNKYLNKYATILDDDRINYENAKFGTPPRKVEYIREQRLQSKMRKACQENEYRRT